MIVVQTPLRISFLGGGTDFDGFYMNNGGGAVLSTAINKYVFVIVKQAFDDLIHVNYSRKEIVHDVHEVKHDLVREAMKAAGVVTGVEITTLSDVPSEGTGLGSSSSITVALLHALRTFRGEVTTPEALARDACRIEIDVLGRPIGRQDQYAAAYGNLRLFRFKDQGVYVEDVRMDDEDRKKLGEHLLLFYTGINRKAETILAEQKANITEKVAVLREMAELAERGRRALEEGAFEELGRLLHQGWELKKQLAGKISNPLIDEIYATARKAGALGGKITGAGGGGFFLVFCPPKKRDDVRYVLRGFRELPIALERDGSKVLLNH